MLLGHRLGKTLPEIRELSIEDLSLYAAFYRDHDPDRAKDYRAAMICSTIFNCRYPKANTTPEDWLGEEVLLTEAEFELRAEGWCAAFAGQGGGVK